MARRHLICLTACAALLSNAAHAQNLLSNPYFDHQLDGWQYSPAGVSWTSSIDYPAEGSTATGAMKLDGAATPSIAYQCVAVVDSVEYVASMRVNSHCTDQQMYVFWTDDTCIAGTSSVRASSTHADIWELVSVPARPPVGTTWALVAASNPGGTCRNPAFVDDVVFEVDTLFADGFEPPVAP